MKPLFFFLIVISTSIALAQEPSGEWILPGLISTVLGTMLSGIGIYKRQTAQLFKELEV